MFRTALRASTICGAALGLAGAMLGSHAAYANAAANCAALNNTTLTMNGTATTLSLQAVDVPAGALSEDPALGEFCSVTAVVSSTGNPQESQIVIAVDMPANGWNGRFLGTGNGGFAGSVSSGTLLIGLIEGYAVANTDMGTGLLFKCNGLFCGSKQGVAETGNTPGGLYQDPAALRDFGYLSTHLMTLAGKQLTAAYYGKAPSYSYFHGCSTGGQEALMEAQRYPKDYDAILAGSPAYDRTHLHIGSSAIYEATHYAPDAYLTYAALALAHQGVLSACAGKDGGLATDDFLMRPPICSFDATTLQCTGAANEVPCTSQTATSCSCLTADQAATMNRDWSGAKTGGGGTLYPGYERGTEEPVALTAANGYVGNLGLLWQESGTEPAFDSLEYWAFGPDWKWQRLFSDTNTLQGEKVSRILAADYTRVGGDTFAGVLNANSTDLQAFTANGGKLLMYVGYADPLIPTASAIDYYNAVQAVDPSNVGNYLRLFTAPGMWHCSGGPGANTFGNLTSTFPPVPGDPADDVLGALVAWREAGQAPSKIIATKYTNDDEAEGIAFQRPLCAYPKNAVYDTAKAGDPAQAASWTCQGAPLVRNQTFTKGFGPN
jgi:feruloyl esterase